MAGNKVFNNADLLEKIIHSENKRKVAGVNKACSITSSSLYGLPPSSYRWEERYISEMIKLQERDMANLAAIIIMIVVAIIMLMVVLR